MPLSRARQTRSKALGTLGVRRLERPDPDLIWPRTVSFQKEWALTSTSLVKGRLVQSLMATGLSVGRGTPGGQAELQGAPSRWSLATASPEQCPEAVPSDHPRRAGRDGPWWGLWGCATAWLLA